MARRGAKLTVVVVALACLGLASVAGSSAESERRPLYEAEALTIVVDRAAREIRGTLVADSVYWHMCWGGAEAHVKIRRHMPGHDKLVGEDPYTDYDGNWKVRFRGTAAKGKRVYAEVPGFNECAAARSRTVTAP
jgi:hypothetical protein